MKMNKNVIFAVMISVSLLMTIGCPTSVDDGVGVSLAVTFQSVVQTGGASETADSTGLILTFSDDPTTLAASDITLTGATKGALSGTGTTRILNISDITVSNGSLIFIEVMNPSGYSISDSSKAAVVYKDTRDGIAFVSAVQIGGATGTTDSTGLTLTFDDDPTTLTVDDITLIGATKGALSGTDTTRILAISDITVGNGQAVSIEIASPEGFAITGSPRTATVYRYNPVVFQGAEQTGGSSLTADSTGLTLTFDVDPTTLTADDITLTGATRGELSGSGTSRSLAISDITVGDGQTVSVEISSPAGFSLSESPQTAVVYRVPCIGMPYQGGIIAYFFQDGDPGYVSGEMHGLIAATEDQNSGERIQWYNGSYILTGASGTALGTGQANTTAIVTVQAEGSYAAMLCDEYTNTDTGTGVYPNWYLPSLDELNLLYLNKNAIGGFSDYSYWSSSESAYNTAEIITFSSGDQNSTNKSTYYGVRAVRSF